MCEREYTKLQRLGMNEREEDMKYIFSLDRYACLYLLRSAHGGGVARIKDSVQVDSLFIHPLPPTSTMPLTSLWVSAMQLDLCK